MAGKRSEKLERLVKVQRHIEELAEADLAETNRERSRARQALEETVAAMGSISPTHQVFSPVYARRIAVLSMKEQRLSGLAAAQERRVLSERAKADRLTERMGTARTEEMRAEEEETLYDLIDRIGLGNSGSSLP
ncbi:MAG TPA: hypothetical protein VFJ18_00210 [Pararhizobium sp.]|nr:hypothetical protein [Pararhizobium sp.]